MQEEKLRKIKKKRKIEFDIKIGKRKIVRKRNGKSMKKLQKNGERERKYKRQREKCFYMFIMY